MGETNALLRFATPYYGNKEGSRGFAQLRFDI
jgi:hypothetical protein